MTYCCSQCDFISQFESALKMHQELHHETPNGENGNKKGTESGKSKTMPRSMSPTSIFNKYKGPKALNRTSSATRLFDKLRSRICRSRTLFAHPEENAAHGFNGLTANTTSDISEGTSKVLKHNDSRMTTLTAVRDTKENYSCHLCNFDADRITVLDRHLLNDHEIRLETLLKLVMTKTREGLKDANGPITFGNRQPYYNSSMDMTDEGEFMIETVAPKIKILKNRSTNTDLRWNEIPDLKNNCQVITKELENMMNNSERYEKEDFLGKMQALNEYMCRFVNSSKTLKKTLTKEFGSKSSVRDRINGDQQLFDLSADTPRDWERCHSEKIDRSRTKYADSNSHTRSEKKIGVDSYYF